MPLPAFKSPSNHELYLQLVIVNFSSAVGRVVPIILVPKFEVYNIVISCVLTCGGLMFCMLGLNTVASTIAFAVIFGFFTGTCQYRLWLAIAS